MPSAPSLATTFAGGADQSHVRAEAQDDFGVFSF